MVDRPYTLLSCCMSMDGYLAGVGRRRLLLSNDADFDRVDAVRAECDAILVGAATVRKDDPRLTVRTPARRNARVARGLSPSPAKVTLTCGARLDPAARFFTDGDSERLVYCASSVIEQAQTALAGAATVVDGGTCSTGASGGSWSRAAEPSTRSSSPPISPTSSTWWWLRSSSATTEPGGSSATAPSRSIRNAGRGWPRFARSATSCCCGTRCPPGSAQHDAGRTA
jgi:hypothetical protein